MESTWSVAKHDTIPLVELALNPLEEHAYLFAFLNADGSEYVPPYQGIRDEIETIVSDAQQRRRQGQAPSAGISDERVRTWLAVFQSFGIVRVDELEKKLHLTALGRAIRDLYRTIDDRIAGANDRLATMAIHVLERQCLRNPLNGMDYPEDSDVHPYRFLWRAMRSLDNKIHWEEVNRVIMRVLYAKDEDAAIERIRVARRAANGVYDAQNVAALGKPTVDEGNETQRRISPWFSQAGFGGYLITSSNDDEGYRHLQNSYIPLIDEALGNPSDIPDSARTSREAYLNYITGLDQLTSAPLTAGKDAFDAVVAAAKRFGQRKIVCVAGIPGTGKSHIARLAANALVEYDPYRFAEIQFHPGTSYEDFVEGFVPKPGGDGFELQPKTLRIMNRRARLDPDGKPYVILIEEFTRADVQAVMGELLTYIEHRDRPFRFAISNQEDRLAPNLIVITTMNPRDRSAAALDQAVLRRLHRVPVGPSAAELHKLLEGQIPEEILSRLEGWFRDNINTIPFGHAEFVDARSESDLRSVWQGTLLPFLLDVAGNVREIYRSLADSYPWQ